MKRRLMSMMAVPFALVIGLSACSSSDSDGGGVATAGGSVQSSASAGATSDEDRQVEFSKCMRENGVEVADPGSGGGPQANGNVDQAKMQEALEACRDKLPNGGNVQLNSEQIEQSRQLAACMRENGVPDFPDPNADGTIDMNSGIDPNDSNVQEALEKCQQYVPQQGASASAGSN